ncbi:Isochorismatase-like protein, partial [Mycena latifolia]
MPSTYLVSGLPQTALIVIDVQQAFIDPSFLKRERSTPNMKPNIIALLAVFRTMGLPKFDPKGESQWNEKTHPEGVLPQDYVVPQAGEPDVLDAQGIKTIILVGQSSPHCVSSTARAGFDLGLSVVVVGDACATYAAGISDFSGAAPGGGGEGKASSAETVHGVAMAHLDGDLADVVGTAEVLKCL